MAATFLHRCAGAGPLLFTQLTVIVGIEFIDHFLPFFRVARRSFLFANRHSYRSQREHNHGGPHEQ
jgi:hypothetical protein